VKGLINGIVGGLRSWEDATYWVSRMWRVHKLIRTPNSDTPESSLIKAGGAGAWEALQDYGMEEAISDG
jgi:hypothetical protein